MFIQGRLPPASSGEPLEKKDAEGKSFVPAQASPKLSRLAPHFRFGSLGTQNFNFSRGRGPMQRQPSTPPSHLESCLQRRRRRTHFFPCPHLDRREPPCSRPILVPFFSAPRHLPTSSGKHHIYRGLEKSRQDAGTSCGDEFVSLTSLSCPAARPDGFLTVACTDTNAGERQTGRKAQLSNIAAAKTCVSPPRPRHRLRRIWKMDTRRGG